MKKVLEYIKTHRGLIVTSVLSLGLVVSIIATSTSTPTKTTKFTKVAWLAQTTAVATSDGITDYTPTPLDIKNYGILSVKVIPATQLINKVASNNVVSDAIINSSNDTVAMVSTGVKPADRVIYTAYLLPGQIPTLLATFKAKKADLNVTAPQSSTGSTTTTLVNGRGAALGNTTTQYGSTHSFANIYGGPSINLQGGTSVSPATPFPWFKVFLFGVLIWALISYTRRRRAFKASVVGGDGANVDGGIVPTERFSDVAGQEEAVESMMELVSFINNPAPFEKVGAKLPKGALLVGPPGTGKTLLARALAGEAGIPFYSCAGSDFVEMYVGVGAKRVRDLFDKAAKHPRSIIFIDEIDAVGSKRSDNNSGGAQENNSTLNALLTKMDGFNKTGIVVLGATNRADVLDEALIRPGRLDHMIHVVLPDRKGRLAILKVHTVGKPLAEGVDLDIISRRSSRMSGADLAQIVNEACLSAARAQRDEVTNEDFDSALATITMGKARKSAVVSEEDNKVTAWHEAGHAICGLVQKDAPSPASISIIPRGPAGGVTHFPEPDSNYMTRKQMHAQLIVAMGGMAAEQMLFGNDEFTTGPSGDLQMASNLSGQMVANYGMGEKLHVHRGNAFTQGELSEAQRAEADRMMRDALQSAKVLLNKNRKLFDAFVDALILHETLTNEDIVNLSKGREVVETVVHPLVKRRSSVEKVSGVAIGVGKSVKKGATAGVKAGVKVGVKTLNPKNLAPKVPAKGRKKPNKEIA
jgi:cell division protease FtsH